MNTKPNSKTNLPRTRRAARIVAYLLSSLAILTTVLQTQSVYAGSTTIVIVEAYGGGGNSGSTYKNDFIGLFNRGTADVDVTGWSVQYTSLTGTTWSKTDLSGVIPAGGYYLVKEAAGTGGTTDLPTPDTTGTIAMGGTGFKIALCRTTTLLSGATPVSADIVDLVGAGTTATAYEGAPGPAPSNTTSVQRKSGGCIDSDNNAADFTAGAPNPRNSGTAVNVCLSVIPPTITTPPASQSRLLNENVTFTVVVDGTAPFSYQWYQGTTPLTDNAQISGSTTNILTISNLTLANAGDYTVVVTNAAGSATSTPPATLTVSSQPPVVLSQPVSQAAFAGTKVAFRVAAYGVAPYTYRWQKDDVDIPEGGQYSGTTTPTLLVDNVDAGNVGNYKAIVSGAQGSGNVTSDPAALTLTESGTLVKWDFNLVGINRTNPPPSYGVADATTAPVVVPESFIAQPGSANDPIASVLGATNYYWGSASYPAQSTSNKTAGLRFNVSTVGKRNITIGYTQRASSTASKYTRLQYTTNGTDFVDYPFSSAFAGASTWESRSFSLVGFPGVNNNANFGIRVVSEFQNTATYGQSNSATYLGVTSGYGTGGTLSYDIVAINAQAITNSATSPVLSAIPEQIVPAGTPSVTVNFTVSGGTTPYDSVADLLFGDPNITSGYVTLAGSSGTINFTPFGEGTTPVIVRVTDAAGNVGSATFNFTVVPPVPFITLLPHTNMLVNGTLTIPFTIGDAHDPASSLTLAKLTTNPALAPDANVVLGGSGSNRSLTITPVADKTGVAPIRLTVTNTGGRTNSTAFTVMVRPSTNVVFNDDFDYPDGSLVPNSFNLWNSHSGTFGQMDTTSGVLNVTGFEGEDCNALLIGQPYATNSGLTLYSSFVVNFSALPASSGTYFAHFMLDTFGFSARVMAYTNNAASGSYRLGIGNNTGTAASTAQFPMDLQLGTSYTVVTRLVLTNGISTLWINPTTEASQSVTATDTPTPREILAYAFRQANNEGTMTVDNFKVGLSMGDVIPITTPAAIPLTVQLINGEAVLSWSNPAFGLEASSVVDSGYSRINGATSPYTNSISGNSKFFRLVWP